MGALVNHWLELTLTGLTSFLSGGISMWYMQRGTCRTCRIRNGVVSVALPVIEWLYRWPGIGAKAMQIFMMWAIMGPAIEMAKQAGPRTKRGLVSIANKMGGMRHG